MQFFFIIFRTRLLFFAFCKKLFFENVKSQIFFYMYLSSPIFFLHNLESEIFNQKKRRKKNHTQYIYYLTSSEWSEKISSSDSGI